MIRSAVRALLGQVAKRVARDGLFEQPGERGRAEVLKWEKEGGAEKAAELREARPTVRRPATGCVPAGLEEARALLRPSGRSLVINHWATWCEPCVDELPRLVRAAAGIGDRAEVLGLSWDLFDRSGDPAKVAAEVGAFAESYGVGYGSALFTGSPEELYALCGLDWHFIPQTVVLGPDGAVRWHKKGIIEDDDVFALIRAATEGR